MFKDLQVMHIVRNTLPTRTSIALAVVAIGISGMCLIIDAFAAITS